MSNVDCATSSEQLVKVDQRRPSGVMPMGLKSLFMGDKAADKIQTICKYWAPQLYCVCNEVQEISP